MEKRVLTFDEAVKYTGLSRSYLYKLTSAKKIPHYKPHGKMLFFELAELEGWLLQNKISTSSEISDKAQTYCAKNKIGKTAPQS